MTVTVFGFGAGALTVGMGSSSTALPFRRLNVMRGMGGCASTTGDLLTEPTAYIAYNAILAMYNMDNTLKPSCKIVLPKPTGQR